MQIRVRRGGEAVSAPIAALPTIRVLSVPAPDWGGVRAYAIDEDGRPIPGAWHICSNPGFAIHDMGFTSEWKHEEYLARYPQGFRLVSQLDGVLSEIQREVRP
jgi:hypothetical protein